MLYTLATMTPVVWGLGSDHSGFVCGRSDALLRHIRIFLCYSLPGNFTLPSCTPTKGENMAILHQDFYWTLFAIALVP